MKQNFKVPIVNWGVTMTEIPDHVALFVNVGQCECHCKGCHSSYLWDTEECERMTPGQLFDVIGSYKDLIDTVVFMGGNRNCMDFEEFAEEVLKPVKELGYHVGIYLGAWDATDLFIAAQYCRYVKVGLYRENLGGLESPTTNQIFMEIQNYKFRKDEK